MPVVDATTVNTVWQCAFNFYSSTHPTVGAKSIIFTTFLSIFVCVGVTVCAGLSREIPVRLAVDF